MMNRMTRSAFRSLHEIYLQELVKLQGQWRWEHEQGGVKAWQTYYATMKDQFRDTVAAKDGVIEAQRVRIALLERKVALLERIVRTRERP